MCLPLPTKSTMAQRSLATLQALQGKFRKLAATQPATKQDGQNRSIPLSGERLAIG
jgi:hypothetical protein